MHRLIVHPWMPNPGSSGCRNLDPVDPRIQNPGSYIRSFAVSSVIMQIEICLQVRILAEQVGQTFALDTESSFIRQYQRILQPLELGGDLLSAAGCPHAALRRYDQQRGDAFRLPVAQTTRFSCSAAFDTPA